jgi:hypothetical protein
MTLAPYKSTGAPPLLPLSHSLVFFNTKHSTIKIHTSLNFTLRRPNRFTKVYFILYLLFKNAP